MIVGETNWIIEVVCYGVVIESWVESVNIGYLLNGYEWEGCPNHRLLWYGMLDKVKGG